VYGVAHGHLRRGGDLGCELRDFGFVKRYHSRRDAPDFSTRAVSGQEIARAHAGFRFSFRVG
jgi:hypothetical protein